MISILLLSISLSFIFSLVAALNDPYSGTCTGGDFSGPATMRFELTSNVWAPSSLGRQMRGGLLWIVPVRNSTRNSTIDEEFPVVGVLSTSLNNTYIATGTTGKIASPCPPSNHGYQNSSDPESTSPADYVESTSPSMTCFGYYNVSAERRAPYPETQANFSGAPETAANTNHLLRTHIPYATGNLELSLYENWSPDNSSWALQLQLYANLLAIMGFVDVIVEQRFGLGFNSTLLNAFYKAGYVASRTIGLYYGIPKLDISPPDTETNGTLVLGGYSTKRLQGTFATPPYKIARWSLPRPCPWEVDITSISSPPDPSTQPTSSTLTACIEPDEPSLALPSTLATALNSTTSPVTIVLTNGLNVTIPRYLASIRAIPDGDTPILGVPFLTQTYLFADHQTRELSIGLANHEPRIPNETDEIECVQHDVKEGDLGLASEGDVAATVSATEGRGGGGAEGGSGSGSVSGVASPSATSGAGLARGDGKGTTGMIGVGMCLVVSWLIV